MQTLFVSSTTGICSILCANDVLDKFYIKTSVGLVCSTTPLEYA